LRQQRRHVRVLPVTAVDLQEVLAGEAMAAAEVPHGPEEGAGLGLDAFMLFDATEHVAGEGVADEVAFGHKIILSKLI